MAEGLKSGEGQSVIQGTHTLCVEMGMYADISWESRCNIEILKCLSSLLLDFVAFWSQPQVKMMPRKTLNYQKLVKDASNLDSFYGSHNDVML